MLKIQYTYKNLLSLLFVVGSLATFAAFFIGRLLYARYYACVEVPLYTLFLTLAMVGIFLFIATIHIRMYLRESSVIGATSEGLHLKNGTTKYFSEVETFLPLGIIGFQIQLKDGWRYNPGYINPEDANGIFKLVKAHIENSANREQIVESINSTIKKNHYAAAYQTIVLSLIMMALPFLPFMPATTRWPLIVLSFLPLGWALYKRFYQRPKTFDQLHGVKAIDW